MDQLLYGFDTALYSFFWKVQNPVTIGLAEICQHMGDKTAYIICLVAALVLCFPKVTRKYGVAMVVGFLVAYLVVNVMIKPGVGRPRPYVTLQQTPFWETYEPHWKNAGSPLEDDDSFPSGHTSLNFTIFTALTALLLKEKKKWAWLLMIIPFVVGFTRIIRCVHYPSDVVGGMIFGIAAGLIGYLVATKLFPPQQQAINSNSNPNSKPDKDGSNQRNAEKAPVRDGRPS